MSNPINPVQLAQEITPEQFEQLVRSYVTRQAGYASPKIARQLFLQAGWNTNGTIEHFQWTLGSSYNGIETKGEILDLVVLEANRRVGWSEVSRFKMIEAEPVDQPGTTPEQQIRSDAVPF